MANVVLTELARKEFDALPVVIRIRVQSVLQRLADWPAVSGAKPLRGELAGNYRIRTGNYRIVFDVTSHAGISKRRGGQASEEVTIRVWKIGHRGGVYD
jgi:mRNA-degrading endonuclease RelE of RelBE toxin-antitoxin system